MKQLKIYLLALLIISCSKDDTNESPEPIIGTWAQFGEGIMFGDGTNQFHEYEYYCDTLGHFSFKKDGSFRAETFDGPDDGCFSTGVVTGTWENQGESYFLKIMTDSSDTPEIGEEANLKIKFPDKNTMHWIYETESGEVDYSYDEFKRVE